MGFNINEIITTKLHYKEIALTVAMVEYQRLYKDTSKKVLKEMEKLVNRFGSEMYNCPDDEPNRH